MEGQSDIMPSGRGDITVKKPKAPRPNIKNVFSSQPSTPNVSSETSPLPSPKNNGIEDGVSK